MPAGYQSALTLFDDDGGSNNYNDDGNNADDDTSIHVCTSFFCVLSADGGKYTK